MSNVLSRLCFHKNGKPRRWLRKTLVRRDGKIRSVFRRIVFKKNGKPRQRFSEWILSGSPINKTKHVREHIAIRTAALRPLTVYQDTNPVERINLVTDSVGPSSLFGGVGTAIIVASLWAKKTNSTLRIITRTEKPHTNAVASVLKANKLELEINVEFEYSPHFNANAVSISSKDLFLATSWWTARSLLNTVPAERIVYLLQEDERMFYPYGDDHLECSKTLAAPFALVLVNSNILCQHLTNGGHAIQKPAAKYLSFEPAFTYSPRNVSTKPREKYKLFFYARPNNPRNLYYTGLDLLNKAVQRGVLDARKWELHAVGKGSEELSFDSDFSTFNHSPMPWAEYVEFLKGMDAGFSLMYTPHPSYPPLDMAATGVPVLTNRFGIKTDLKMYSDNIICKDLSEEDMMFGFQELTKLAEDPAECERRMRSDSIRRDWKETLSELITELQALSKKDY